MTAGEEVNVKDFGQDEDAARLKDKLDALVKGADELRSSAVFDNDYQALGAFSEQHFLAGLALLEAAQRQLALAAIWYIRGD